LPGGRLYVAVFIAFPGLTAAIGTPHRSELKVGRSTTSNRSSDDDLRPERVPRATRALFLEKAGRFT
jgi:hypothetical protein